MDEYKQDSGILDVRVDDRMKYMESLRLNGFSS